MKIYRIYTEDKPNLAALASGYFDSFTLLKGIGYWKGVPEPCVIIEVIQTQGFIAPEVRALAREIKSENHQETVLITEQNIEAELI